ncbi:MAG: succinate dehydrogenase, hydrophobic membrane anchor protein [Micavibrio sp.]|nr:succinate dehydrogenase, hydrophobic membrane anchor protein [Micavibrio sp.]|tara:strand:- start:371 stop:766 length:396 start_codon:yes stop_codon:yes gene_type:complete
MKLKWDKSGMKTPLARARGLGAAGHGSDHWMAQRITAFANVPLVIWFVYSLVSLKGADYVSFTTWLAEPVNAILAILFIISNFYHAALGLQVVIEDYIHCEVMKTVKLVVMKLVLFGLGTAAIFSILKIAL